MPVDPFSDPQDDESPQMREVREHAKELEKQLRAKGKELEAATEALAEAQTSTRISAAETLGLSRRQAATYLKDLPEGGEINQETVAAWRVEMGYDAAPPKAEAPTDGGDQPAPAAPQHLGPSGFAPASGGGTSPDARISYEDYRVLLAKDFNAAARAVAEDRVDGIYKPE